MSAQNPHRAPERGLRCFNEPIDEKVKRFTASVAFDQRLAPLRMCGLHTRECWRSNRSFRRRIWRYRTWIDRHSQPKSLRAASYWRVDLEDAHEHRIARLVRRSVRRTSECTTGRSQTTRWLPTCAGGCAAKSTSSIELFARLQRALVDKPEQLHPPSCPAFHICKSRAGDPSQTPPDGGRGMFARDESRMMDLKARKPFAARCGGACRDELSNRPRICC